MAVGNTPKTKTERRLRDTAGANITAQAMAAAAPTKAEFDSLATKFNTLIAQMKTAGTMKNS